MAEQVVPGLYRIGFGGINAYLLGAGEPTLVDTGLPKRQRAVGAALKEAGLRLKDLRHIAITHYHVDHIGNVAALAKPSGAAVYVHASDAAVLREGKEAPRPTFVGIERALMPVIRPIAPRRAAPAPVHREISDGEELPGGLRVVHTPGHTGGHVSFFWPERGGVLFVGDAAWNWVGRLTLPYSFEDLQGVKASLRKIAALNFEIAVFGHGRVIRGGAAARFRRLVERVAR